MELRPTIGITAATEDNRLESSKQYVESVDKAGAFPLLISPRRKVKDTALEIDGLLISGGADLHPSYYNEKVDCEIKIVPRKRSDFELAMIYEIMKSKKPIFGVCYGMQLINVALGGSLYQDIKAQVKDSIDHKKGCHIIKVSSNRLIESGEYSVNSSHHQAVKAMGRNLSAIAFSADNIIEAIFMAGYPFLLGVQWHPERTRDELSEKIFRSFVESADADK